MSNLNEELDDKKEQITNKDRFYFVLAYVPIINVILLFLTLPKINNLERHLRQWLVLFWLYILLFILGSIFHLWFLFTFLYVFSILFFWAKAYSWEYVEIEFLEKIADFFSSNKNTKK